MAYKFFDKKTFGSAVKSENMTNQELAEKLDKVNIRKLQKQKVYSPFIDKIWGADFADMQLISKYNKGTRFLLFDVDIFSKYGWVILWKDKKLLQLLILFKKSYANQKNMGSKGSQFYNRSMKSRLQIIMKKCIQRIMKENLLLLKYLLET